MDGWTRYWLRLFGDQSPAEIVRRFGLSHSSGGQISTWLTAGEDAARVRPAARRAHHEAAVWCLYMAGAKPANDNATQEEVFDG